MSQGARVESVDALRAFRAALLKFAECANIALADAEGEIHRTLLWLETEQQTYWQNQIRRRADIVARCKEAVRMKKLFKNAAGSRDSAVDEEKALALAQRALAEAEQKLANVRSSRRKLEKEIALYKGSVQRFATSVEADIPVAVAKLDAMVARIEAYLQLSLGMAGASSQPASSSEPPSVSRGLGISLEELQQPPPSDPREPPQNQES